MSVDIAGLRALIAAATPEPWEVTRDEETEMTTIRAAAAWFEDYGSRMYGVRPIAVLAEGNLNEADAELVAASRAALPAALDEIERLHDALRVCEWVLCRIQPTQVELGAAEDAAGAYGSDWTREMAAADLPLDEIFAHEEGDWGDA